MIEPKVLLEKITQAYATFEVFRCRGALTRVIYPKSRPDSPIESRFSMRLCIARSGNFFLQWCLNHWSDRMNHTIIAMDSQVISHSFGEMQWTREGSIEDILAGHTGISGGLAIQIPALVMGFNIPFLDRFEEVDEVKEQGAECYLIKGYRGESWRRTVIIRTADWVILRVSDHLRDEQGEYTSDFAYTNIETTLEPID
ncbi:MAG TPA: hypothetical protein VMF06_19415 [Candidatus Limnocylindria bacterium]|jgi:hypothetical protein|nr:hypothetical protein [Candidatus Limnocylindria bacterium]